MIRRSDPSIGEVTIASAIEGITSQACSTSRLGERIDSRRRRASWGDSSALTTATVIGSRAGRKDSNTANAYSSPTPRPNKEEPSPRRRASDNAFPTLTESLHSTSRKSKKTRGCSGSRRPTNTRRSPHSSPATTKTGDGISRRVRRTRSNHVFILPSLSTTPPCCSPRGSGLSPQPPYSKPQLLVPDLPPRQPSMLSSMPLSPQALRRRAKKFLVRNQLQLFVPVLPGLERLTAEQAKSIGQEIRIVHGGIEFRGDLASIYRANLAVRTGNRVLLRLGQFLSQSYPMLYNHARRIDWPAVLGNCPDVSIDVSARESRLNHKEGIRQAILDAIRSSMAEHDVNTVLVDGGPLTVKARLYQDRCTLSLDTTGEHLHKRGYRSHATTAPIRETTAAGMLLLAQSKSYDVIIDPFCGSGTFAIEAELIARNYPPGMSRRFAIENSPLHAPGMLRHIGRQLLASASDHSTQTVLGFDISPTAIQSAKYNADKAPTTGVKFAVCDALALDFSSLLPEGTKGLIAANLPYGVRLGTRTKTQSLVRAFCSVVARTAVGWDFLLIMPEADPVREPGLLVERTLSFSNGGIPVVASLGRVEQR